MIITTVMFVLWNVLNVMPDPMKFVSISMGIVFSFSLCLNLAKRWPGLFSSFRDYTFQIFLMGIFFQMAIRWIFVKWGNDMLFVPMWLMSVVVGVYVPIVIARLIEHKASKGVRMCLGL